MRQGFDPRGPGYGLAAWQSLVECKNGLFILGYHPVGDIRQINFGEIVLRRGHVVGARNHADQVVEEVVSRQGYCHQQHGVNEDEVGPAQGKLTLNQPEDDVDEEGEDKKEKDGSGRRTVDAHGGGLKHKDDKGRAEADYQ